MRETDKRKVFARRLYRMRTERGWTQEALAYRAGMDTSAIGHYENGSRMPNCTALIRLKKALGCSFDELLSGL